MTILHLTLKKKWFDLIARGEMEDGSVWVPMFRNAFKTRKMDVEVKDE